MQVRPIDVQDAEPMAKLSHLHRTLPQLIPGKHATTVLVDLVKDLPQHLLFLNLVAIHVIRQTLHVLGPDLCEGLDYHCDDQVHHTVHQRQQRSGEEDEGPRIFCNDRDRHRSPVIPSDDGFEEGDVRKKNCGEGQPTTIAPRPSASIGELLDERVDEFHSGHGPNCHDHTHENHGPKQSLKAASHHLYQLSQLSEYRETPDYTKDSEETQQAQHAYTT
mmetsp:Transcript_61530/g.138825  ORF Transcript_61530/g.138825 Transcript_61530/m.138825 type:complete len:219 (-) Transcript_61530:21-677(-)